MIQPDFRKNFNGRYTARFSLCVTVFRTVRRIAICKFHEANAGPKMTRYPLKTLIAAVGLALAVTQTVNAQLPKSAAEAKTSFAPVVKLVAPSVVNVYAAGVERGQRNPLLDDPIFRRFFGGDGFPAQERVRRSQGSGVIVDPSGLIVTNQHVIEGMTEIKIALSDKREFAAEIVLRDPRTDLAVLKLQGISRLAAIELGDSDGIEVGDLVLAIGNPFGVGQTVTQGIVSALARTQVGAADYQFFIQTDAAINPGNSGGALVDVDGRLVGINTAIFSQSGGSHGIGFAIPVNMIKVVVASAQTGGKAVRRPWFGARLQAVTSDIADNLGLDRPVGALISDVARGSPAAEAGLKAGDVILAIGKQAVDDNEAFGFRFATMPLGGSVDLSVRRQGKIFTASVKLIAAPETRPRDRQTIGGKWPLAGSVIATLSPALADELSLDPLSDGVVVMEVTRDSPAERVGLKRGDVLVSIDGEKVQSSRDVIALARVRQYYWKLVIWRDGELMTTNIGG